MRTLTVSAGRVSGVTKVGVTWSGLLPPSPLVTPPDRVTNLRWLGVNSMGWSVSFDGLYWENEHTV